MKCTMESIYLILLGSIFAVTSSALHAQPVQPVVSYNKETDTLSVTAKDASFSNVMAHIASTSGIDIQMDDRAEHTITATLKDTPIEKALKELSRNTNAVFLYSDAPSEKKPGKTTSNKPILTGMQILPKGEAGNALLHPLIAANGEAYIREKDRHAQPAKKVEIFNHAQQRWEARLKAMPSERREALLKSTEEKIARDKKRHEENELAKKQHDAERDARKQERLKRDEKLKVTNPDAYARREQQRQELRQNSNPPQ